MDNVNYYAIPGLKYKNKDTSALHRSPDDIITLICNHTGVSVEGVLSKCRRQTLVIPRHAIIHFLYTYTILNKSDIGRKLNRDHTTVKKALETIQDRIDTEEPIRALMNDLKEKILITT